MLVYLHITTGSLGQTHIFLGHFQPIVLGLTQYYIDPAVDQWDKKYCPQSPHCFPELQFQQRTKWWEKDKKPHLSISKLENILISQVDQERIDTFKIKDTNVREQLKCRKQLIFLCPLNWNTTNVPSLGKRNVFGELGPLTSPQKIPS